MMTGRERVMAIIAGKPVDRCAYWTGNPHEASWPGLFKYFNCETPEALYQMLGDDVRWVPIGGYDGVPFGCFSQCETAADVDSAFRWPNPADCDFTPWLSELQQHAGYYRISGNLSMFFHSSGFNGFGGMQEYFTSMYTRPEVVHAVTKRSNDYFLALNERFFRQAGDLMEAYKVSHDLGTQTNLLLSPAMLEEFVFPYLQQQIDLGHSYGYQIFMHCCGAIRGILPRMIDMGIDLLHPIQALAQGMDAESLREFRAKVTFVGGIDTQQLLVSGSEKEVAAEVLRVAKILGPMIISPSHEAILPDVPPRNLAALARAVTGK